MPSWWVSDLCERALNARISEGFVSLWRSGLLHVVDKQRVDAKGRKMVDRSLWGSSWLFVGLLVECHVLS